MGSNEFLAVSALHLASLRVAPSTKGRRGRSLVCCGIPATYDVNESMLVWIIAQSNPKEGRGVSRGIRCTIVRVPTRYCNRTLALTLAWRALLKQLSAISRYLIINGARHLR